VSRFRHTVADETHDVRLQHRAAVVDLSHAMGLAVLSLALNALACFAFAANDELGMGFAAVGAVFLMLQLLGTLLLNSHNTGGAGYVLVWVGAIFFVPLGLLGPLGARQYRRKLQLEASADAMSPSW